MPIPKSEPSEKNQYLKLKPFVNTTGTPSWRITGTLPDGTRIRQHFHEKADAIKQMADLELEVEGEPEARRAMRTLLSAEPLSDAESASRQVNGHGLSKLVAHYFNLQARAKRKGADLDQAIAFFETRYRVETNEITILNAKAEYLSTRHDISEATIHAEAPSSPSLRSYRHRIDSPSAARRRGRALCSSVQFYGPEVGSPFATTSRLH